MKVKKLAAMIAVAVLLIVSLSVAIARQVPPSEDYSTGNTAPTGATQWITVTVDGSAANIDTYADNMWYDVQQLTTERDVTIAIGDYTGYDITINGEKVQPNTSIALRLEALRPDLGIAIETVNKTTDVKTTNYIRTLPVPYYAATILSNEPSEGYYYFNLYNYIYKIDGMGNVVYYKSLGEADGIPSGFDFKRTEVDGNIYYSYLNSTAPGEYPLLSEVNYARSFATVMDENYNEIDTVYYVTDGEEETPLHNFQFTILGENHYLVSASVGKRVDNIPDTVPHSTLGARVVANVLQEIKDGQVIWQWDSTDYPELYAMSATGDYFNENEMWSDYARFTAVAVDPKDDNFICSFQNLNAILKLDRKTGEILWVLGGNADQFGLTEEQKFSGQSDIRLGADGALTIFNNGTVFGVTDEETQEPVGETTVITVRLNEATKSIETFEEYTLERSYSEQYGSAQEIADGQYVVGWGTSQTKNALFSEIDFHTNKVLFEFCYPEGSKTYRVYKDIA